MRKKYLEHSFTKDTLVAGEKSVPLTPTGSKEKGKRKVVELSPEVEEIPRPKIPFTRSLTRKLHSQEGTPTKDQPTTKDNKSTSPSEGKYTKQPREAQNVIIQLREENWQIKLKLNQHLDDCEPIIDNSRAMIRRTLPLHK
jgi:hypothetical protein